MRKCDSVYSSVIIAVDVPLDLPL